MAWLLQAGSSCSAHILMLSPYRGGFVAKILGDYFLQIATAPDECFLQGDCFLPNDHFPQHYRLSHFANSPDQYFLQDDCFLPDDCFLQGDYFSHFASFPDGYVL
jgi:hypothetical protein